MPDHDNSYEKVSAVVDASLKKWGLGTCVHAYRLVVGLFILCAFADYLDMYLIHSPPKGTQPRLEMWRALIDAKKAGKVRTIGVSN